MIAYFCNYPGEAIYPYIITQQINEEISVHFLTLPVRKLLPYLHIKHHLESNSTISAIGTFLIRNLTVTTTVFTKELASHTPRFLFRPVSNCLLLFVFHNWIRRYVFVENKVRLITMWTGFPLFARVENTR